MAPYFHGLILPVNLNQDIYKADINPDGTLGAWTSAGLLPEGLQGFGLVASGDKLIVIGGRRAGDEEIANVRSATVDGDGNVSGWTELAALPGPVYRAGVAKVGDQVVVVGGFGGGTALNTVYYADLLPDGNTGAWQTSVNSLPVGTCCAALAIANGYAYFSGGFSDNYTDRVYAARVPALPIIIPSPTPLPFPTPIPESRKVVFLPGMGGSWNADALLNCKADGYSGGWTLAPYARPVYRRLLAALAARGEVSEFNYDWRRQIVENGAELAEHIDGFAGGGRTNLVGHSMGGLVGRAYLEEAGGSSRLEKMLTVGSPHRGTALAYPAWSAGKFWSDNLLVKIGETILLKRCGARGNNDRLVLRENIPSWQNLLPVFDYLRDRASGNLKSVGTMMAQNNWQPTEFEPPYFGVNLGTLAGSGEPTIEEIGVGRRTRRDILMGDWEDGRPMGRIKTTERGDGAVLLTSAQLDDADNRVINKNHEGLVKSREGVAEILDFLGWGEEAAGVEEAVSSELLIMSPDADVELAGGEVEAGSGIAAVANPRRGRFSARIRPRREA